MEHGKTFVGIVGPESKKAFVEKTIDELVDVIDLCLMKPSEKVVGGGSSVDGLKPQGQGSIDIDQV